MNFLAHLYLSGEQSGTMVGNFIGDFVKGRKSLERFPSAIAAGIELHRAIDEFTDAHAVVASSKKRLRPKYRHYSGVIVDVFYDHFLARNWPDYHPWALSDFAANAYDVIRQHDPILPGEVKRMLPYMISGNWLLHYAEIEGIHQALSGMARRTPYESKMNEASEDLRRDYDAYQGEFKTFFPEIRRFVTDWLVRGNDLPTEGT